MSQEQFIRMGERNQIETSPYWLMVKVCSLSISLTQAKMMLIHEMVRMPTIYFISLFFTFLFRGIQSGIHYSFPPYVLTKTLWLSWKMNQDLPDLWLTPEPLHHPAINQSYSQF